MKVIIELSQEESKQQQEAQSEHTGSFENLVLSRLIKNNFANTMRVY
jgi:hypothetical protein